MGTPTNDALKALAAQLHARLRHEAGRVIDVIWMVQNAGYARETLRPVCTLPAQETLQLAARFETLMFGTVLSPSRNEDDTARATRFLGKPL